MDKEQIKQIIEYRPYSFRLKRTPWYFNDYYEVICEEQVMFISSTRIEAEELVNMCNGGYLIGITTALSFIEKKIKP